MPLPGTDEAKLTLSEDGTLTGSGWIGPDEQEDKEVGVPFRLTSADGSVLVVTVPASLANNGELSVTPEQLASASSGSGVVSAVALDANGQTLPDTQVSVTPTIEIDSEDALAQDSLVVRLDGWIGLDGTEISAPTAGLNVLDPVTHEVLASAPLDTLSDTLADSLDGTDPGQAEALVPTAMLRRLHSALVSSPGLASTGLFSIAVSDESGVTVHSEPMTILLADETPALTLPTVSAEGAGTAPTSAGTGSSTTGGASSSDRTIVVTPGEQAAAGQGASGATSTQASPDRWRSAPSGGLVPGSDPLRRAVDRLAGTDSVATDQRRSTTLGGGAGQAQGARPASAPTAPVADASALTASNAGSLSGSRSGNTVTLILPTSSAREGDWVSVFVYPGAQSSGWEKVDSANSVSVDVSALTTGTYQLAVADRDNELLGWAQLEIVDTSDQDGAALVLTSTGSGALLGPSDWMLVSAGGLLMLGAASFIVLARPARLSPRP